MIQYWYYWVLGTALLALLIIRWLRTEEGQAKFDEWKLRVPVAGEILKKLILVRVCRSLAAMLGSGVPILQALDVVGDVSGNRVYKLALQDIREEIERGEGMAATFEATGVFTQMITQLISVGEQTGEMGEMLQRAATYHEDEVENTLET